MTVKDIQNVMSSLTAVHLYVAKSREDAINGYKQYMFAFTKSTALSNNYARLKVAYIYPEAKDDLEVCAINQL